MAERIQRQRAAGWRMPAGAVYVGRPSIWGNPFVYRTPAGLARVPAVDGSAWEYEGRISAPGQRHDCFHPDGTWTCHTIRYLTRGECVELFERALLRPDKRIRLWHRAERRPLTVEDVRRELSGKDLVCWCPIVSDEGQPVACHADVLLRVANGGESS